MKEVELTEAHGYLVYKMKIIGEDMKKYKVLVDPGNGSILYQGEVTYSDYDHKKMGITAKGAWISARSHPPCDMSDKPGRCSAEGCEHDGR